MTETDYRIDGSYEYRVARRKPMRVHDDIRKCAAFVYYRDRENIDRPVGTAFFVKMEDPETGRSFHYAVTAKHTIDDIAETTRKFNNRRVYLRINHIEDVKDDKRDVRSRLHETEIEDWVPAHNPDVIKPAFDLAVLPFQVTGEMVVQAIPLAMFATPEVIKDHHIGIGDDTVMTGLFLNQPGNAKVLPIVRMGSIAMMPDEPMEIARSAYDRAYLIETRSMTGLSGCPVFVRVGHGARADDGRYGAARETMLLLGIIVAHCRAKQKIEDEPTVRDMREQNLNSGIAIAIPAHRLADHIKESHQLRQLRENAPEVP